MGLFGWLGGKADDAGEAVSSAVGESKSFFDGIGDWYRRVKRRRREREHSESVRNSLARRHGSLATAGTLAGVGVATVMVLSSPCVGKAQMLEVEGTEICAVPAKDTKGDVWWYFQAGGAVHAIPSNALPASALPASAIPSNALPASALPASAIPSNALPASALPASALPASAIPSNSVQSAVLKSMVDDSSKGAVSHAFETAGPGCSYSSGAAQSEAKGWVDAVFATYVCDDGSRGGSVVFETPAEPGVELAVGPESQEIGESATQGAESVSETTVEAAGEVDTEGGAEEAGEQAEETADSPTNDSGTTETGSEADDTSPPPDDTSQTADEPSTSPPVAMDVRFDLADVESGDIYRLRVLYGDYDPDGGELIIAGASCVSGCSVLEGLSVISTDTEDMVRIVFASAGSGAGSIEIHYTAEDDEGEQATGVATIDFMWGLANETDPPTITNISPTYTDLRESPCTEGFPCKSSCVELAESAEIFVEVYDDSGVDSVTLYYWGGDEGSVVMSPTSWEDVYRGEIGPYGHDFLSGGTSTEIYFYIVARDVYGNEASLDSSIVISVVDCSA